MKRVKFVLIIFFTIGNLTGCGLSAYSNADNISDNVMDQIGDAINESDSSKLRLLFSEEIQSRESLSDEAEEFLNSIEGDFVSYDYDMGSVRETRNEKKGYTCIIMSCYTLITTENTYEIEFIIYPTAITEEKRGVQSLGIQTKEDSENEVCVSPDYKGIYTVTSDNHDEIRALEEAACEED